MLLVAAVVLSLCVVLMVQWGWGWWQLRRRIEECGRALPGPPPLPVIGNILYFGLNMYEIFPKMLKLWHDYGDLIRVWMGPDLVVVLSNARDIEVLLSHVQYIEKSLFYKFLHSWLGTGLLTSSGQKWHSHRKIITPTFHFKILENFVDIFNKHGEIFISKLKHEVGGESFEISHYIDLYTEDVICESAMGVKLDLQVNEKNASEYLNAVKSQCELFIDRASRPWLYSDTIYNWSKFSRLERKNLSILHGMTNKVIADRKQELANTDTCKDPEEDDIGRKKRFVFLDLLLLSAENGKHLSDNDIREEVDTFMFEGHDTTSSAICFALYELSHHPDIQARIHEELTQICHGSQLELTLESLNNLKYTEMVIKETLRMYPSVPIFSRRLQHDMQLVSRNVVVPPNVNIMVSSYTVHRDAENFPNPDTFNPDHFLPEVVQRRHPFAYIPFSAGPRNCIGQKFAMLEMKSIIAKIIWNYILEPSPEFSPKLIVGLTLKTENGIKLRIKSRNEHIT